LEAMDIKTLNVLRLCDGWAFHVLVISWSLSSMNIDLFPKM